MSAEPIRICLPVREVSVSPELEVLIRSAEARRARLTRALDVWICGEVERIDREMERLAATPPAPPE